MLSHVEVADGCVHDSAWFVVRGFHCYQQSASERHASLRVADSVRLPLFKLTDMIGTVD